MTGILSEY